MRLGFISDIHEEFGYKKLIIPECDVVVVAGDLHTDRAGALRKLEEIRDRANAPVIYVLGNHEYYCQNFPGVQQDYRAYINNPFHRGLFFLEKGSLIVGTTRFLGTTLWSDLSDPIHAYLAKMRVNDFSYIQAGKDNERTLEPEDATREWRTCAQWLRSQLEMPFDGKTVVVTHHSPSSITSAGDDRTSDIRFAYHSNMEDLIFDCGPDVWVYGHDHISAEHELGDTRLVSRACGYDVKEVEVGVIEV